MASKRLLAALLTAVVLQTPCICAQDDEETRFHGLEHFPSDTLLYVSIDSVAQLVSQWKTTLLGRLASHPGWRQAFRRVFERITAEEDFGEVQQAFIDVTGKTPLELLSLPRGEIALALRYLPGAPLPEVALALELGETRSDLLGVVARLREFVGRETGQRPEAREVGGVETVVWPGPVGAIYETLLADHIVFVSSPALLREVSEAYRGGRAGKRLRDSDFHRNLSERLGVASPRVQIGVDLAALYRIAQTFLADSPDSEEVRRVVEFLGADRMTAAGLALGFRDAALEYAFHVGARQPRGLLDALLGAIGPLEVTPEALARIPASTNEVGASSVAPGKILRGLVDLIRRYFPEAQEQLDEVFRAIAQETGIDVERDLFTLPQGTFYGFTAPPPAGGLFADRLLLLPSETFTAYIAIVQKIATKLEAGTQTVPASSGTEDAPPVRYLTLAGGNVVSGAFWRMITERGGAEPSIPSLLSMLVPTISWAELPGGWTVASTAPQAVVRYVTHYRQQPALGTTSALGRHLLEHGAGAGAASVFQSGKAILWTYNSLLSVANAFGSFLQGFGVDLASVPPAEVFLDAVRPGYARVTATAEGLTLRGHRAHATSAVAVLALGAGVVWGIPALTYAF